MKRVLSMLLIVCLLMPVGAACAKTYGYIKDQTEIYTGPGMEYYAPNVDLAYATQVEAISRAWDDYVGAWWVLVEFM